MSFVLPGNFHGHRGPIPQPFRHITHSANVLDDDFRDAAVVPRCIQLLLQLGARMVKVKIVKSEYGRVGLDGHHELSVDLRGPFCDVRPGAHRYLA